MRGDFERRLFRDLIVNLVMGLGLGAFLSLTLIVSDAAHIFEMIVNSSSPRMTALMFVGIITAILVVGSAISGLIFSAIEER
jgi:hypothetical protein